MRGAGFLLAWIGIEGIQRNRMLLLQAKNGDIYADHDPFQKTLLVSRAALRDVGREEEKENRRRRKRQQAREAERAAVQARVDHLLDRITEVGIDALSPRERRELAKSSQQLSEMDSSP